MGHFHNIPFFKKAFGMHPDVELTTLNWELVRYISEMTEFNNLETYEEIYPTFDTYDFFCFVTDVGLDFELVTTDGLLWVSCINYNNNTKSSVFLEIEEDAHNYIPSMGLYAIAKMYGFGE